MAIGILNPRLKMLGGAIIMSGLLSLTAAPAFAAGTEVSVEMWDKTDGTQGMTLSSDKVKAGKVTFKVTNTSKSEQEHEFLIVKTDLTSDQLPFVQEGARVDETKFKGIKEGGDLEPGQTKTLVLTLKPGTYLLFCNEVGHFKAGMHTTLTVTP